MALYMGSPNLMGFGGNKPVGPSMPDPQGGLGSAPVGPRPVGPEPWKPRPVPPQDNPAGGNTLQPQAIRATGPSQGYDPAYLQNLATAIGGLFAGPQSGGNTMNINPLGNLGEISPPSGIGGNAPTLGEPMTWLQQAINGGGFAYSPSQAAPTPVNGSPAVVAQQPNGGRRNPLLPARNQ
jgi:hypothetical protein